MATMFQGLSYVCNFYLVSSNMDRTLATYMMEVGRVGLSVNLISRVDLVLIDFYS